jgi:hypothetical protein
MKHPSKMTPEERERNLLGLLTQIARLEFSMNSFEAYFELVFGMRLPKHMKDEVIPQIFDSYKNEKGTVVELFRGAAKTTVVTIGLGSYLIGKFPDKALLLIQVGDDIANDNSKQIADIIEHNRGFKSVFPHVVPDKTKGWGANGYEVKRTDISYEKWREINAKRKDPSLVGVGYKSSAIIGKRPWGLIVDDINNEMNTASERELIKVKKILTGTIFPAANQAKVRIFIGTPWTESDALHYALTTGEFDHIKIPVLREGVLSWPEIYNEKEVEKQKNYAGEIEFARMYLLDLEKTKGLVLKKEWLRYWPHDEINPDWMTFFGVDFTSTEDPTKEKGDFFALAVGKVIPGGKGMVITGGVRARVTQAEAENSVIAETARYPTLIQVGIEAIITGQMFYNNLLNNAELRASGVILDPIRFNKKKGHRYEVELAPMFQRGRVYLSDAENPFLREFKKEWISWQGDSLADLGHDDTLDAVYACVRTAEQWITPITQMARRTANPFFTPKLEKNPFSRISRY